MSQWPEIRDPRVEDLGTSGNFREVVGEESGDVVESDSGTPGIASCVSGPAGDYGADRSQNRQNVSRLRAL